MSKADIIGAVVMSRLMGGTFNIKNIYSSDYVMVTTVLDLHEGDRHIWRYVICKDVFMVPDLADIDAKTHADYVDEMDRVYARALAGDEKLFAKGQLMEGANV